MASSAFSFHCMICFEEFDTHTNYPVVLPCGHTYVCIECANRLDKCMECREPLTIKCEIAAPSPPPPGRMPGTPNTPSFPRSNGATANSPGRLRQYGYRNEYNINNNRGGSHAAPPPTPPKPVPRQRLPLPKNAVLLSLIQASEPARRRAEVEAPPTPQKTVNDGDTLESGLESPPRANRRNLIEGSRSFSLLKEEEELCTNDTSISNLVGSKPEDEEHKIRVGTYLEGGPCGTYAVAAKSGLLVYPTLFEHTLPSAMNNLKDEDVVKREVEELVKKHGANAGMTVFDNIAALAAAASNEEDDGDDGIQSLTVSLTLSEDDESDDGGSDKMDFTSARILPVRRSRTIHGAAAVHRTKSPLRLSRDDPSSSQTTKLLRHFSLGSYPKPSQTKTKNSGKNEDALVCEFERPLTRLKHGDRVQVVSMDTRGWVKLARGYGYIRLENEKQLVKVGGTSDKACQIEAMLHELSLERNRLKREQMKLERLSAGLMIDLQSSLITSDDHVVVSAPEGSLLRSESEVSPSQLATNRQLDKPSENVSLDDIDVSNRTKTMMETPPRSKNRRIRSPTHDSGDTALREIRKTQSESPGRTFSLGQTTANTPLSPPYSSNINRSWSSVSNSPMRVNFRTGMSGHGALTSSHVHPHDFIENNRGQGTTIRSMSNHAGIMTNLYIPNTFWESPCAGGM